jgi:DNA-binding NtrC family response regulator
MSPRLQVKVLRVLQDGTFEPVGSDRTVRADVRVVAATNKDLQEEIRHGRFRKDLFFRLNVIPIVLPPLRDRREDIPVLVHHFLEKYGRANDKTVDRLSRDVLDLLLEYPWPGNVRELENCIERAVVLSHDGTLPASLLPREVIEHRKGHARPAPAEGPADADRALRAIADFARGASDLAATRENLLRAVEETIIRQALDGGMSQRELAVKLGLSRMTLRKKMRELDINL